MHKCWQGSSVPLDKIFPSPFTACVQVSCVQVSCGRVSITENNVACSIQIRLYIKTRAYYCWVVTNTVPKVFFIKNCKKNTSPYTHARYLYFNSMAIFHFSLWGVTVSPTYYGLMYSFGFLAGYFLLRYKKVLPFDQIDILLLYILAWVVLGGRFGYVLFYAPLFYLQHPLQILQTWQWWMSFHGGAIGVIMAIALYCKQQKQSFLKIADIIVTVVPIGLGLGRIGNYINGELYGFPNYFWPFAIVHTGVSYFPSELLESFLEGPVLFVLLWQLFNRKKFDGQIGAFFLLFYGFFRTFSEFFRLPDAPIGYLFHTHFITLGQVLSLPMILVWWYILAFGFTCPKKPIKACLAHFKFFK